MAEYLRDTFGRAVTLGWGTSEVGGTYGYLHSSGVVTTKVASNRGVFDWLSGSGGSGYTRTASAQAEAEVHGAITMRCADATLTARAYLFVRTVGTAPTWDGYAIRIGRTSAGVMEAELVRGPSDAPVVLATLPSPPSWPTVTNYATAEIEVTGSNPTTVRGRWYFSGSPPAADTGWLEVTDSLGPQGAGTYGVRGVRGGTVVSNIFVSSVYVAAPLRPSFLATPSFDGLTYAFDSAMSTGDPVAWDWDFGDGSAHATTKTANHTYAVGTYIVTLTLTTRWGTKRTAVQTIEVTGETPPVPDVQPVVYLDGQDVCDRLFSVTWRTGARRWGDDLAGSACTLQLRGRFPDVVMGSRVVLQLPPGAPQGPDLLWSGEVDTVSESLDAVDAKTVTTIVAMDVTAFLGRWHILPATSMVEGGLPTRVASLAPRASTVYRQKWTGVLTARWPILKALAYTTDKLVERTYLDVLKEGLRGSIAQAYVAPDGAIVYAPIDPPVGLVPPVIDLDTAGPDCAVEVDVSKITTDGLINRWTVGEGASVDRVDQPSIEAYGENQWKVGTGVLKTESTFPVTDAIAGGFRDPYPGLRVRIPLRDWAAKSILVEPLDIVSFEGVLYGVTGVAHRSDLSGWEVELNLDRDPWTLSGTTPPVTPPTTVKTSTQTFSCNKDALLASSNMGAGKIGRLAVGYWSGTKFRALMQFDIAYAHKPTKIVKAELLLSTAGQDMVGYGSSPQVNVDRVTGSWSEGSYGNATSPWVFSTSNAVVYPGPSVTTTGRKTVSVTGAESKDVTIAITEIARAWLTGSANRGVRIISTSEGSTTRTTEFHSRESTSTSRRPQLRVTYEWI